jgi:hypothetical protein|tara:strand:- start:545 stop:844 length:300 start_codon:yes stop_codon:yes gene_type:complete
MLVTILIIAAIATTVGFILYKKGDQDGDGDVDLKDIKSSAKKEVREVKKRVKRVKEELKDVGDAIKEVADQAGDIVDAAKGKSRKGRKPAAKKSAPKKK